MSGRTGSRAQLSLGPGKTSQPGTNGSTEQQQKHEQKKMSDAYVNLKKLDSNPQNQKDQDKNKKKQEPQQPNVSKIPQATSGKPQQQQNATKTQEKPTSATNASESLKKPAKNDEKEKVQNGAEKNNGNAAEQKESQNAKNSLEKKREIKETKLEKPGSAVTTKEELTGKKEGVAADTAVEKNNSEVESSSSSSSTNKTNTEKRTPTRTSHRAAAVAAVVGAAVVVTNIDLDINVNDRKEKQETEKQDKSSNDMKVDEVVVERKAPEVPAHIAPPTATSTPGKPLLSKFAPKDSKREAKLTMSDIPLPRSLSQISGRPPIRDYTPSKYAGNTAYGTYRRLNTDLNDSTFTNTSMNVTVGSERPNSSSFSFFGFGRKRDRAGSPHSQSAVESENELETSPAKRSRLDINSILTTMTSPITNLRSRFSKASLASPMVKKSFDEEEQQDDVQNVSGVVADEEAVEGTSDADVSMASETEKPDNEIKASDDDEEKKEKAEPGDDETSAAGEDSDDIKVREEPSKKPGCEVM